MPEPNCFESPAAPDPAGRDGRAETLLLEGLDQYFAGRYEDAIHIWTRVLFLDRAHSRARAYIDRARSAMAERQRHADELLEAGHELLGQGRTRAARHLLDEVVAEGGEDERAAALRLRLDRLEQFERLARGSTPLAPATPARIDARSWSWPSPSRVVATVLVLGGAAWMVGLLVAPHVSDWAGVSDRAEPPVATANAPWPLLSTSEVALVRARTAFGRGRLADALKALERVNADSPFRTDADRLRVRIQQAVVASGPGRSPTEAGRR